MNDYVENLENVKIVEIGKNACIESLGRSFVEAHKADACFAVQEMADRLFCFLGIDLSSKDRKLCLSNENDRDAFSYCFVKDGKVIPGKRKL